VGACYVEQRPIGVAFVMVVIVDMNEIQCEMYYHLSWLLVHFKTVDLEKSIGPEQSYITAIYYTVQIQTKNHLQTSQLTL